jgi:predicted MFS family arabinose efflux permease
VTDAKSFADFILPCQIETTMPFNDYWTGAPPLASMSKLALAAPPLAGIALAVAGGMLHWWSTGMAILLGFVLFESRREDPLLDVNLLRRRVIAGIVIAMFCAQFLLTGFFIYIATYFQHILGFGPLETAAAILPAALIAPYAALVIGRITDRLGARRPAIFGYGIAAVALIWLALFVGEDEYWLLVPGLFMLSLATAPMFTALLTALSNAVDADERGDANALVLTIRWIGAAAGTMVLGVVIHSTETGAGIPTDSGYSTAFLVAAGAALVGVLACATLLHDPPPGKQRKQHHFRPHF